MHFNVRKYEYQFMGDTKTNALIANTSLFFFIVIEFSRFLKRNRTRWPHYHIKLESEHNMFKIKCFIFTLNFH